ncbi:glycosyltransferase family 2 protein [Vagococcus elongatus]|uniref:Glycosyltransferase 2-like domain-containing protein n=1 Tax=Vagococcus elongatus TaxID=180344 RepID=A0A430B1T6_9ENTE|nr:glycosyltransferase family 2 protein [Vagococcus elongatus]RSU14259.1 hypothetical protein CBF29_02855 [Vagococcus elongatus]
MKETEKIRVAVLMSTYNGERYLQTQIDSILKQKGYFTLDLIVRDDGSTDGTLKILENYQNKGKLKYFEGKNLGPAQSFLDLLSKVQNYDYYAFSDQDDFWLEDKILRATNCLHRIEENKMKMYHSATTLTDKDLNIIEDMYMKKEKWDYVDFLIRNNVTGCTLVISRELASLINDYRPKKIMMHDHWIALLCTVMNGELIYDKESRILYRQHENNVLGHKKNNYKKLLDNSIFQKRTNNRSMMIKELTRGYSKLIPINNLRLLQQAISSTDSLNNAVKFLSNKQVRLSKNYSMWFCIAVLLKKF